MKRSLEMVGIVWALIVVGALSLAALPAHATLLNLSLPGYPDISISYLAINYTASTDSFHAEGFSDTYTDPTDTPYSAGLGAYTLDATITDAGMLTGGSFIIDGDLDGDSVYETLLTGNLDLGAEGTAFGASSDGNDLFEFRYTVTGGSLANDFGGLGAPGGVIMYPAGSTFDGSWGFDFSNDGGGNAVGYAEHAPIIPEPTSFLLLVLGAALCVTTHCRRKRTRVLSMA